MSRERGQGQPEAALLAQLRTDLLGSATTTNDAQAPPTHPAAITARLTQAADLAGAAFDLLAGHLRPASQPATPGAGPPSTGPLDSRSIRVTARDAVRLARADVERKPTPTEYVKNAAETCGLVDDKHNLLFLLCRMCSAIAHGDTWVLPLFPIEVIEPIRPGVSMVQITAPTPYLVAGVQGAIVTLQHARRLYNERGSTHL